MSKKRKAEGLNTSLPRKISPNAISTGPLSAFAAAKAKAQNDHLARLADMGFHKETLANRNDRSISQSSDDAARPKTIHLTRVNQSHDEGEIDKSTRLRTLPDWDGSLELRQHFRSEQSALGSVELEQETVTKQNVQLSSWKPTSTNVRSSTTKGERLYLAYGQTLTVLGHYKLKVLEGLITISGTFLTPTSAEQEVLTTSVFALPPIKCISSAGAEIELLQLPTRRRHFEGLQRLSPLFSNLLHGSSNASSFTKVL
jgi:hypothetical protein